MAWRTTTIRPACSCSHLADLIVEASTPTPRQTCGTGFEEFDFGTASRDCVLAPAAPGPSGFHLLRVFGGLNIDAILGMWHWA